MFSTRVFATTLLWLTLTPTTALACPQLNNPFSDAYGRRDNNRCEGLKSRDASSIEFTLTSFVSRDVDFEANHYPGTLSLKIPNVNNQQPRFEMQSSVRNYYLDNVAFKNSSANYIFNLPTDVLKRIQIPANTLQATAHISDQSQRVYLPVILGQPSGKYEFTISFPRRTAFPVLEIRQNKKTVSGSQNPRPNPTRRAITYTWNYQQASKGRYELYVVAKEGDKERPYSFFFNHDPNRLR